MSFVIVFVFYYLLRVCPFFFFFLLFFKKKFIHFYYISNLYQHNFALWISHWPRHLIFFSLHIEILEIKVFTHFKIIIWIFVIIQMAFKQSNKPRKDWEGRAQGLSGIGLPECEQRPNRGNMIYLWIYLCNEY